MWTIERRFILTSLSAFSVLYPPLHGLSRKDSLILFPRGNSLTIPSPGGRG
jgi:hypothetical protein